MDSNAFSSPINSSVQENLIKVIGIGSGGCGIVRFIRQVRLENISFATYDANVIALDKYEDIFMEIQFSKILFIIAYMDEVLGMETIPVIARVAKELNVTTVGILIIPPSYDTTDGKILEQNKSIKNVMQYTDSLQIIHGKSIVSSLGADFNIQNIINQHVLTIIGDIMNIITRNNMVAMDFADINWALKGGGLGFVSSGIGKGRKRIENAIQDALKLPLCDGLDISEAKRLLLNFTYGKEENVSLLKDMDTIKHFIETMSFVETTFGFERGSNNISENAVKVTVVASGFEKNEK